MINATESHQEVAKPRTQRQLPHVLYHEPDQTVCLVYKKFFEDIIDNKARLVMKVLMLGHIEYLDRSRKNAVVRNGRVMSTWHGLTERYWAKVLKKHPETIRLALNELEAEGLIERLAVYDELGAPRARLRNRGFPDRNRPVALNIEVIDQRMVARMSNLRTTSLDSFSQPLCTDFRGSEDSIVCVQEIPKSLSSERDLSHSSGSSAVSTPARKKRKGSRDDIWVLSQPAPANDWFRRLQKSPVLVAALLALGFDQITAPQARMWLRHMSNMTASQREEIFCEMATRPVPANRNIKSLIKWLKRKREDCSADFIPTLVEQKSTHAVLNDSIRAHPKLKGFLVSPQCLINSTLTALQFKDRDTKRILEHISRGYLPVFDIVTGDAFGLLIPFRQPRKNKAHAYN